MSIVFEFLLEFVLTFFIELLGAGVEGGVEKISDGRLRFKASPLWYLLLLPAAALFLGALSARFHPLLLSTKTLRIANLLVTPLIAGFGMHMIGNLKRARGKQALVLDAFVSGYVFALAFAIGRWLAAAVV